MTTLLRRGAVAWANLDPTQGREQAGGRPVVVVSSDLYLDVVDSLAIVLPVTSTDRGWPNHVPLGGAHGLPQECWAMTEQPRTIARSRISEVSGMVDRKTLDDLDVWLRDFLRL